MKSWLFLVPFIVLGCVETNQQVTTHANVAAGQITEAISAASRNVNSAIPHTDSTGKAYLTSASGDLTSATAQLPPLVAATTRLDQVSQENATLKADWWSYRQHLAWKKIIIWTSVIIALLITLWVLTAVQGPIGIAAAIVFHVCTAFLFLIGAKLKSLISPAPATTTLNK